MLSRKRFIISLILFFVLSSSASAQSGVQTLILEGVEIFNVSDQNDITGEERVIIIVRRFEQLLEEQIEIIPILIKSEDSIRIMISEYPLITVYQTDARIAGLSLESLAAKITSKLLKLKQVGDVEQSKPLPPSQGLNNLFSDISKRYNLSYLTFNLVLSLTLFLILLILIWILTRVFHRIYEKVYQRLLNLELHWRIGAFELLSSKLLNRILLGFVRLAHLLLSLGVILLFSNYILTLFPDGKSGFAHFGNNWLRC